jgi:ComEC/Rec2-related protein
MKPPIITVIGSLSFAFGCLVVASHADRLTAGSRLLQRIANENPDAPLFVNQLIACLELAWPALLLVALAGATLAWLAGKRLLVLILLLLPLLATIYAVSRLPKPAPSDLWFQRNAGNVECICRVESVRNKNSLICSALEMTLPARRRLEGKVLITIFGGSLESDRFKVGETVRVLGRIAQLHDSPVSWHRSERGRLIASRIFSKISTDEKHITAEKVLAPVQSSPTPIRICDADDIEIHKLCKGWQEFWERGREQIIRVHANSLGCQKGDLLSSMVLGDRVVKLPKETKELFRNVGLSHLLAASGFNLSIVVASSYFLARLLPIRPQFASLFALLSTICFVCLAGPSPSVVRAAMLCIFFLAAKLYARKLHSLAALSLVLTVALMVDPMSASDVGLQLSYLATAGIISGAQSPFGRPKAKGPVEKIWRWLQDCISVICLAQLSVLPLQLMYFQYAGILFLPANLLVDPVVAPVTVLGFLSSIVAFAVSLLPFNISGSAVFIELIDKLTSLPLDYMLQCASWLASIKGTMIRMGPPVPFALPIYYLCLAYSFYVFPRKNLRLLGVLVLLSGLSVLLFRPNIPGEIVYLSQKTALTLTTKSARMLNGNETDWLGRQLIDYSGIDKTRIERYSDKAQQISMTSIRRRSKTVSTTPVILSVRETQNFAIVSNVASSDSGVEMPLTWTQTKIAIDYLGQGCALNTGKPIVIWIKGFKTEIKKCAFIEKRRVYLAFVDNRKPLLISLAPGKAADEMLVRSEHFYPLQVLRQENQILVLR